MEQILFMVLIAAGWILTGIATQVFVRFIKKLPMKNKPEVYFWSAFFGPVMIVFVIVAWIMDDL